MLVSWYSAGISSLIATYLLRDKIDKVIYIDIDNQHSDSQRFVKDSEKLLGKEIEQLKSRYGSVENCIKTFKYVNGPSGARCTMMLKKRVRKEWEDSQTEPLEYVWGLDLDEKHRAGRIVEAMPNNVHHFPLINADLTKQDCHGMAFRLGIKRPVMYDLGYNNNNCIGCVKGGMGYWNKIRIDFPEVFEKMALLEREVGGSCIKNCYLDELNVEQGRHTDLIVEDCGIFCELNLH